MKYLVVLLTIWLVGCSADTSVDVLCTALPSHIKTYSQGEREEISKAIQAYPSVRKPVETSVGIKELYESRCNE